MLGNGTPLSRAARPTLRGNKDKDPTHNIQAVPRTVLSRPTQLPRSALPVSRFLGCAPSVLPQILLQVHIVCVAKEHGSLDRRIRSLKLKGKRFLELQVCYFVRKCGLLCPLSCIRENINGLSRLCLHEFRCRWWRKA